MKVKNYTLTLLLIIFILMSFFIKRGFADDEAPERWFIQIKDNCHDEFSKHLIVAIEKELDEKRFIINEEGKITLLESHENIVNSSVHSFFIFSKDIEPGQGDGRVYMCFNPKNAEGEYNASFLLFIYQNDTWQRILNPGTFRFQKEFQQTDLQTRISRLVVGLTFK